MDIEEAISSQNPSSCHKKKKRKKHGNDPNSTEENHCVEEGFSVKDTTIEPPDFVTSETVKRKKNKRKESDNVEMDSTEPESTLSVGVPTRADATNLDPSADVTSKKKGRNREKNSDIDKIKTLDSERTLLVPDKLSSDDVPIKSEDTSLILTDDVCVRKKNTKRRPKRSDGIEATTVDNESSLIVCSEVDDTSGEKKNKRKKAKRGGDVEETKAEDTGTEAKADSTSRDEGRKRETNGDRDVETTIVDNDSAVLDPIGVVTSGKKKRNKMKKESQSGDVEATTVDNEIIKLDRKKAKEISIEPEADGTSRDGRRKKESRSSNVVESTIVDNDTTDLNPIADVTSGKKRKKRKKESQSGDVETETMDSESTLFVPPTKAEETRLEPASDVTLGKKKRKMKREKNVVVTGESLELTTVDDERTLLGNLDSEVNIDQTMDSEKLILEPVVSTESLAREDSVPNSKNKGTKETNKSQNPDSEGKTSEKPEPSADLGCSNKTKGNRKKKKVNGSEDNVFESNDKVGDSLQDSVMDDVVLEKMDSVLPSDKPVAENPQAVSSLSLLNVQDKASIGVEDSENENSLIIEPQIISNGVNNGLVSRRDRDLEVDRSLEPVKIITYKRRRSIDGVLEQVVDVPSEKESASCSVLGISQVPSTLPERTSVPGLRKKLLILDVNGLLVDFVENNPTDRVPDIRISQKDVFKRPYCEEFLEFCFEKFTVAVWTSRMKRNMEAVIDFLFGDSQKKLLFSWDRYHCTMTKFNTIENRWKPLVLKELRKVWDKVEPDLPFEKGDYDETNTLLLDDSPYKALLNPANTAIFPKSYTFTSEGDDFLAPGGALRTYLEGLFSADNVQKYVEQNPFGQPSISRSHRSWDYYRKVIRAMETPSRSTNFSDHYRATRPN